MKLSRFNLLVVGILFHLCYLWSIFDIYFVSPLIHGMQQHQSTPNPPAKRLFLIVGDGLRADTLLTKVQLPKTTLNSSIENTQQEIYLSNDQNSIFLAPYLRSIILNNGTYGISHTRMPTESRPGHVAMIAGFYEDVSAVTKGWKENPVNFDSVFNQSYHTFSFGSPDILPMFKTGASDQDRIQTVMYGHEFEDFTKSSIELDSFVFKNLNDLFLNSTRDPKLDELIHKDKVVFFLHLLGCDTAGHSYRPYSIEYYQNVQYIDNQLKDLIPKINDFFGDEETAFIFTADHGMSALGSHGDGHPNNTRTPFIAFGKGINKPLVRSPLTPIDNTYPEDDPEFNSNVWLLDHIKRNDLKQADIATLMAYLIGVNYPSNSVGKLPLDFIDNNLLVDKLYAFHQNSLSIFEQLKVKEENVRNHQFFYKPFLKFQNISLAKEKYVDNFNAQINQIQLIIDDYYYNTNNELEGGYLDDPHLKTLENQIITLISTFIDDSLEGLNYLQQYNWILLKSIVTFGFIGWIIYSFMIFLNTYILIGTESTATSTSTFNFINSSFTIIVTGISICFNLQKYPIMYYLYLVFPVFFWQQIFSKRAALIKGTRLFFQNTPFFSKIFYFILIISTFEASTYGFFNRKTFSIMFAFLSVYPSFVYKNYKFGENFFWILNCLIMSTFTWSDAIKTESLLEINLGGILMIIISGVGFKKISNQGKIDTSFKINTYSKILINIQVLLIIVMLITTNISVNSLQARNGLPFYSKVSGWATLIISLFVMPILHHFNPDSNLDLRLLILFITFSPTFLIFTISFESLFYCEYSLILLQWIKIETDYKNKKIISSDNKTDWLQILRISIIGFFLCQIAFFGTGNIASISSFSLESVCRLIPVFNPFSMGVLLVLKLLIPYILLSTGLGILNISLSISFFTISTLIISLSDLLSLNFFFLVKTEGSWLDIGMTISNYCIAILSSLFIILLESISQILLKGININNGILKAVKSDHEDSILDLQKELNELNIDDNSIIENIDITDERPISARLRHIRRNE
ncbi:mannose-ethanolamine phosphotransferase MCD4 [Ascoidea rubescens DSM 1968]|uniref:GPI ethanolamine phosphate transferase 1 n=1 Tax=Ascoidea rubescens DSM 1968 TaxID=1344418 RepID=A0A1D2VFW3_9ASCO|nr:PigN-domain-containing protein [Ascoidea rubescens DSM 1968]ODV60568.1 PigN-domain-containing protein [Ascoidea rubescens DSM 1968]